MAATMTRDMTKGEPLRLIVSYSIPLLIGNIFQQLYNLVDTLIVGRYVSMEALAAVGSTGSMNFLVIGFATGLTSGFSVVIAQRFGAKDEKLVRNSIAISTVLCVIFTILVTLISVWAAMPLLKLINTPDDIIQDAYRYIVIIYAGIAATMLYNMLACILRALGDSRTPLYFLILASLLNIALDFLFILGFDMGVAGAGIATVLSQAVSGVLCLFYMKRYYPMLRLQKKDWSMNRKFVLQHLHIGLPMAFQFSITAIGAIVLQGAINIFGSAKIAGYTAAARVENLINAPSVTIGVAMANYTGQNLGANRMDRIREGVRKSTVLTLIVSVLAAAILFIFGEQMTGLFLAGESKEVMDAATDAAMIHLRIAATFFPPLFMIFVYRNTLQGMGRSFMPLMAGVFELVARTLAALTLPAMIGFAGVCLAGPIAWVAAVVPLGITYYVVMRRIMKESPMKEHDV